MKHLVLLFVAMVATTASAVEIPTTTGEPLKITRLADGSYHQPDVDFAALYARIDEDGPQDPWAASGDGE